MLPEIDEITGRRKSLGLTQKELAQLTMTSQSFIAKLESGRISPSYKHVKNIFDILNSMEKKKEDVITARKLYHKRIFYVSENDTVAKAVKIMNRYDISQLPIFSKGHMIGSVTDKIVMDLITKNRNNTKKTYIKDVMDDPFPTINEITPLPVISSLLSHSPAVLVISKGKTVGIITKADLIKVIK